MNDFCLEFKLETKGVTHKTIIHPLFFINHKIKF